MTASELSSVLVTAASSSCPPTIRVIEPDAPPSNRRALARIASKTGWTSICERLMTRRIEDEPALHVSEFLAALARLRRRSMESMENFALDAR
jgi:hypothetical protein